MNRFIVIILFTPLLIFSQNDTQEITFNEGWSIFSTYIVPDENSLENVFSSIIDDIVIIKDQNGNVYWPEYNLNSIGNLTIGSAYQIKLNSTQTLVINGTKVNCNNVITLNEGWNLIGYLQSINTQIELQFSSIQEYLIIIKDGDGNVYWPQYSINTIIDLEPGKGYQIKLLTNTIYNYECLNNCNNYNYSCDGGSWQSEIYWEIQNQSNELIYSGGAPDYGEICLSNECYTIIVTDLYGDGWQGNVLNIGGLSFINENLDGCSNCGLESQTFEVCFPIELIEGCTDLSASNYNADANVDNNSCEYVSSNLDMELISIYEYDEIINDIWGYAINDNEYALVGTNDGFSVVDITNPQSPIEVFFIEGSTTIWRDIKTWQNYAYVVCDNCTDGLLIIDLNDMTGQTYSFTTDFFNKAHNIYIDENGYLYAFGGNPYGAMILNLNYDPMNPTYEGEFDDYYLHDGMVRGDTLWGAAIQEGVFAIIDVNDKSNPSIKSSHPTSSNFTHNCWISNDGNTLFTTDEVSGAYIGAYDVSDIYNIENTDLIQSWSESNNVVPHNTHVIGHYLVTSYYRDGVTIIDASDPYNLVEVAYYDTSPQFEGEGFEGCWGAYPYLPSGLILATDRQNGLHILTTPYSEQFND
tara:strand:- start:2627 stop:4540 length:1914 start_codon:yes stop_codon:yes gene_type:complete